MNHIKQFFREKGLYLFCLAMVFAATAAGILALRTVVSNVADLTRTRKEALQNDSAWTQPYTAIDKPAQDVPKPTTTPAATEKPSATPAPAAAQAPKATAAPPAQTVTKPGIWDAKPLAAFSGNELVYSATLGDWRTHNGADYAAPAGESVTAAKAGKVVSVSEDALWGGVVEVEDANGVTWRYCGVAAPAVKAGDSVTAAAALGTAIMGLVANYPIALAPGMGLNAYFTFTVVKGMGIPWQAALGAVFISGIVFLAISLFKVREAIVNAIPQSLKFAISAGVGMFLAIIALKNAGVIAPHPATYITLGDIHSPTTLLAIMGFFVIVALEYRKIPGSIIIGILLVTALSIVLGLSKFDGILAPVPSMAPTWM